MIRSSDAVGTNRLAAGLIDDYPVTLGCPAPHVDHSLAKASRRALVHYEDAPGGGYAWGLRGQSSLEHALMFTT